MFNVCLIDGQDEIGNVFSLFHQCQGESSPTLFLMGREQKII